MYVESAWCNRPTSGPACCFLPEWWICCTNYPAIRLVIYLFSLLVYHGAWCQIILHKHTPCTWCHAWCADKLQPTLLLFATRLLDSPVFARLHFARHPTNADKHNLLARDAWRFVISIMYNSQRRNACNTRDAPWNYTASFLFCKASLLLCCFLNELSLCTAITITNRWCLNPLQFLSRRCSETVDAFPKLQEEGRQSEVAPGSLNFTLAM